MKDPVRQRIMSSGIFTGILLVGLFLFSGGCINNRLSTTNYYFDPVTGNDSLNPGTLPDAPFKSLAMIRTLSPGPGDSILLKSGALFTEQLFISCMGDSVSPIVIGKYGGPSRPHIKTDGLYNEAVHVYNSEHLVVRDLEISNRGESPIDGINGLLVELDDYGTARDITIDNLFIHDVYGILVREHLGGDNAIHIRNYNDSDTMARSSRFDGLVVRNCHIKDCQRNGIMMWGNWIRSKWNPNLNVVIRNNLIEGVPGDGIVPVACDGPLVEYNIMRDCPPTLPPSEPCDGIWPWSCDNAIVRFNVVSDHRSQVDGYAYDSDWNSRNSLFEYNLSYNNDGGFLLICNSGGWPEDWSAGNTGTRIRYNISINDGLRNYIAPSFDKYYSPVISIGGPTFNTVIEKNLFYLPRKEKPEIDRTICNLGDWGGYPDSTAFKNNYIYVEEEHVALRFNQSTRNFCTDNYYVGELTDPGEGFIRYNGMFNKDMWFDPSDTCWLTLVRFAKDKSVVLNGQSIHVLDIIGFEPNN